MTPTRFEEITGRYPSLSIGLIGDFCLDRYLEIDPARGEVSIETGLPVYNVVNVRAQPGAAGTILNNLVALGIGSLHPVGFCGIDGEGYELQRSLAERRGVDLRHFLQTPERRTFTYCKPLVLVPGSSPRELNRLDSKNWSPTPPSVTRQLAASAAEIAPACSALILMDQVDVPETGVVTRHLLDSIRQWLPGRPELPIVADSRRGLRGFPPVIFKMNAAELAALTDSESATDLSRMAEVAGTLASQQGRPVFVTLSERGILGASADGKVEHVPCRPVRGEIDIVGAGDAVTANLTAALAAGASVREAIELANAAASIVIHQLGTTGTAKVQEIHHLLFH